MRSWVFWVAVAALLLLMGVVQLRTALLECQTYRHHGHSKADPGKYRPPEEVERWLARDPINVARERLAQLGVSDDDVAGVEETIKLRIDRAVQSALAARYPDPAAEHATEFAP